MSETTEQSKSPAAPELMSIDAILAYGKLAATNLHGALDDAKKDSLKQAAAAWASMATMTAVLLPQLVAQQAAINARDTAAEIRMKQAEEFVRGMAQQVAMIQGGGLDQETGLLLPPGARKGRG